MPKCHTIQLNSLQIKVKIKCLRSAFRKEATKVNKWKKSVGGKRDQRSVQQKFKFMFTFYPKEEPHSTFILLCETIGESWRL